MLDLYIVQSPLPPNIFHSALQGAAWAATVLACLAAFCGLYLSFLANAHSTQAVILLDDHRRFQELQSPSTQSDGPMWFGAFWSLEYDQFDFWRRGELNDRTFYYFMSCRNTEFQGTTQIGTENPKTYFEGWNDARNNFGNDLQFRALIDAVAAATLPDEMLSALQSQVEVMDKLAQFKRKVAGFSLIQHIIERDAPCTLNPHKIPVDLHSLNDTFKVRVRANAHLRNPISIRLEGAHQGLVFRFKTHARPHGFQINADQDEITIPLMKKGDMREITISILPDGATARNGCLRFSLSTGGPSKINIPVTTTFS